jgi:hypothetical protein
LQEYSFGSDQAIVRFYQATEKAKKAREWRQRLPQPSPRTRKKSGRSKDPDFDDLGGTAALAKLPGAERRQWGAFCEDVAALEKRAKGTK